MFNLSSLAWRRGPKHPSAILNSGGFSTWDAKRRLLWGHSGDDGGGNAFVAFSPDGVNGCDRGRLARNPSQQNSGEANHNAMQFHPIADVIVLALHARNSLATIDPRYTTAAIAPLKSRGQKPRIHEYAAFQYSPCLNALVYYSASDGAVVHAVVLDGDAQWRSLTNPLSLNPVVDAARQARQPINKAHTFGRFRIADFGEADIALLVRHVDSSVYAMRLTA